MQQDYDEHIAFHYDAFRPDLHTRILTKCLGKERFDNGLDVGCGTGQSSIALAPYCNKVIGIDPSKAMLSRVQINPKIDYREYSGNIFPVKKSRIDIITFAGSLYYAIAQSVVDEVIRVSRSPARIIVYDFEVLLEEVLVTLKINCPSLITNDYNHEVDFSGLEINDFLLLEKQRENIKIGLKAKELAHLILADNNYCKWLEGEFGRSDLYEDVLKRIMTTSVSGQFNVPAKLFYTQYSYKKR